LYRSPIFEQSAIVQVEFLKKWIAWSDTVSGRALDFGLTVSDCALPYPYLCLKNV
jgi:hypothetical protein